jgi:hypothetical protein
LNVRLVILALGDDVIPHEAFEELKVVRGYYEGFFAVPLHHLMIRRRRRRFLDYFAVVSKELLILVDEQGALDGFAVLIEPPM